MPTPRSTPARQRLEHALRALKAQQEAGKRVFRTADLGARSRTALVRHGFLRRVTRGWYVPARPGESAGDTTPWYAAMHEFIGSYCDARFGSAWHLDPATSLAVHTGASRLPAQVVIHSRRGTNNVLALPDGCSLLDYKARDFPPRDRIVRVGALAVLTLPAALVRVSETFFEKAPTDAQIALNVLPDASDLCRELLAGGHRVVAGRLAGALRAIGRPALADEVIGTLRTAGYPAVEDNPFATVPDRPARVRARVRTASPYVQRLELLWARMREAVIEACPSEPGLPMDVDAYLAQVGALYSSDAYHSLSIEGYRVTEDLIATVASGAWRPEANAVDAMTRNAMAAHGYWRAHQAVTASIGRVLRGAPAGEMAWRDHGTWFRELFAPSVDAGLLQATDLAGYRPAPVYIANARHVPPPVEAVREMMPALFELLQQEPSAAVRAVLGHFAFVFIHPYPDGNGRIGRFLMNTMLASGGYPWTVIPVERRMEYFAALDAASAEERIEPFARFISTCMVPQEFMQFLSTGGERSHCP